MGIGDTLVTVGLDGKLVGGVAESWAVDMDRLAVLAGLRDAGRALLVITHDLAVVPVLDGRLAVLEEGRVAEVGPAGCLLANPQSASLRACIAVDPAR